MPPPLGPTQPGEEVGGGIIRASLLFLDGELDLMLMLSSSGEVEMSPLEIVLEIFGKENIKMLV